ncbi:MAG: LapA family protein [Zoogloeaceae bacterium]|jgi:uncharacterized integral membrane protein|nr:LapA family protein [Zoogloeaceae bacterium]
MSVLTWILRLLLFLFVLLFALENTTTVTLNFFYGHSRDAPLVLWLLAFFVTGVLIGILAMVGPLFRARRAITRLQREAGERVVVAAVPDSVNPQTEL